MLSRACLPVAVLVSATAILTASIATAEPGGGSSRYGNDPDSDSRYFFLLTGYPDDIGNMVIWNYPLVRAQGIAACTMADNGIDALQVIDQIEAQGYTWDIASNINSSARVVYCPWNLHKPPV